MEYILSVFGVVVRRKEVNVSCLSNFKIISVVLEKMKTDTVSAHPEALASLSYIAVNVITGSDKQKVESS